MPKILFIDDDPHMRLTVKIALQREGHTVFEAAEGPTGIALARSENPDLIVVDLMMPYMSGLDVIRYIRDDGSLSNIPIIVLSGVNQPEQIIDVLKLQVSDYLLKPVDFKILKQRVKAALERVN